MVELAARSAKAEGARPGSKSRGTHGYDYSLYLYAKAVVNFSIKCVRRLNAPYKHRILH